jgi:hypothetical protein
MTGIVYGSGSKIVAVVSILRFLLSRNLWLKAPENRFHVHCFGDLGFVLHIHIPGLIRKFRGPVGRAGGVCNNHVCILSREGENIIILVADFTVDNCTDIYLELSTCRRSTDL